MFLQEVFARKGKERNMSGNYRKSEIPQRVNPDNVP